MAITINGNGAVTGISVGGLPDGIVDTDMLAANAVLAAKLATTATSLAFMGTQASGQSIASGAWTVATGLTSHSISANTGTSWDTTNGKFTVASGQDGTYIVWGSTRIINMHRWQYLNVGFKINGATPTHYSTVQSPYAGNSSSDVSCFADSFCIKTLSVGDTVEMGIYHDHGSALNTDPVNTAFGGYKIPIF